MIYGNDNENNNRDINKLWLIIKNVAISDKQSNVFFLKGGERIKLGRVLMKVIEVNSEYEDELNEEDIEGSDSNHT